MKKTLISAAVAAAVGVSASAHAANITSMTIADWDSDGIAGGFAFAAGTSTTTKYTHFFDSTSTVMSKYASYTPGGGGIIPTGEQAGVETAAATAFTGGFAFNNYLFAPNSLNAAGSGTTTNPGTGIVSNAVNNLDTSLSFSSFVWSGTFGSQMFPLSPDSGFTTNTLTQGGSCSAAVGSNQACYVLRWEHLIAPQGGFSGDTVWQIEGIVNLDANVNLVPVPAAVWLFGSGLLGLVGVARRKRAA